MPRLNAQHIRLPCAPLPLGGCAHLSLDLLLDQLLLARGPLVVPGIGQGQAQGAERQEGQSVARHSRSVWEAGGAAGQGAPISP